MAGATLTTAAYLLKKLYLGRMPESIANRKHVLMSMLDKQDGFVGDGTFNVPLEYSNPQGVSSTFATGQTNVTATKGIRWALTRPVKYGFAQLTGELLAATKSDDGAFARALRRETDNMFKEMGNKTAIDLYGDGNGSIGRRSSASTNVITLTNADDAKYFKVGMYIQASSALGGTARVGSTDVTAVDFDGGTITLTSAAAITSFSDNDYLYNAGDIALTLTGLAGWLPATAPAVGGGDNFFGVDRSANPVLLAGNRLNAPSNSIEESAQTLAMKIATVAGSNSDKSGFLAPTKWADLSKALGLKIQRDDNGDGGFGFAFIEQYTPAGNVKWYSDPDCPSKVMYILNLEDWHIKHLDGFPHVIDDDGNMSLRLATSDGIEWRGRQWGQLYCTAPGYSGMAVLP